MKPRISTLVWPADDMTVFVWSVYGAASPSQRRRRPEALYRKFWRCRAIHRVYGISVDARHWNPQRAMLTATSVVRRRAAAYALLDITPEERRTGGAAAAAIRDAGAEVASRPRRFPRWRVRSLALRRQSEEETA